MVAQMSDNYKIAIIGCPRGGTKYIATVLQKMGVRVGHEELGPDGIVDWHLLTQPELLERAETILHQVREPLSTIGSLTTIMDSSWEIIKEWMGEGYENKIHLAMATWVYWNKEAEKISSWTYRVEDFVLVELAEHLDLNIWEMNLNHVPIPTNTHSREHRNIGWGELFETDHDLTVEIRKMAVRYGYTLLD